MLQYVLHEEGRIRINSSNNGYLFDYFLKDQLGNTRMTITDDNTAAKPIIDATSYYPFGLSMAGISSQTAGGLENKIKFQTQELQHKEFNDGSGMETYQFKYRMEDPQIGRFWSVDPLADQYTYNSTYAFSEDKVINSIDLEGAEAKLAIAGIGHANTEYALHPSDAGSFLYRADRLKSSGFSVMQVQNGQTLIAALKSATTKEGSIAYVAIFSHSSGAGLYLDYNSGFYTGSSYYSVTDQSATVSDLKTAVNSGSVKFDKNAMILFTGCNTENPESVQEGQEPLAISVAKELGVTTIGATGTVETSNDRQLFVINNGYFVMNKPTTTYTHLKIKLFAQL